MLKSSKFFACGGHSLGHRTYSSAPKLCEFIEIMTLMLTFITTLLLSALKIFLDGLLETFISTAMNSAKYVTLVTLWPLGCTPRTLHIAISYKHICSKSTQTLRAKRAGHRKSKNSAWPENQSAHYLSLPAQNIFFKAWGTGEKLVNCQDCQKSYGSYNSLQKVSVNFSSAFNQSYCSKTIKLAGLVNVRRP